MATEVERMSVVFEASVKKFENQINKQNRQFSRAMREIEDSASKMEGGVSDSFDRVAKIVASAAVIKQIQKLADTWQEATNKIKAAGISDSLTGSTANEIADIAARSRSSFGDIADLYARLTRTGKTFGATQGEIAIATETVAKALKTSGASAAETQSTLVQLGQALGSGRLQGDELRSLLENAPVVVGAIAKEFGVAVGQLKDLGAEGKLVSDRVFKAIVNAAPEVGSAFAKTQATIADSFKAIETAAIKFVGNSSQMSVAARATSGSLQLLANNFDGVATGVGALGAVIAARLVAGGLAPMVAQMGAAVTASTATSAALGVVAARATLATSAVAALRVGLALVGGPVGAAILGTAAVVAYLATQSVQGKDATDRYGAALAALRPPADDAKAAIKGVGDQVAETSARMTDAAKDGFKEKLRVDAVEARNLETTIRSAAAGLAQFGEVGLKAEDKKRGLDLIKQGMDGDEKAAIAAADDLRKLGETNISFANAFASIATMLTRLAAVRNAAAQTRSALSVIESGAANEAAAKKSRDEQAALFKAGAQPVGPALDASADPVLAGIKLQAKVREAEMDKNAKALKAKTKEVYEAALGDGGGVTLKQAEAAAKSILAAEEAAKGGGGGKKDPKSDEDKAENRIERYIDSIKRQNEVLDAEIATFGKSNAERRAAVELAKAHVDLNKLDASTRATLTAGLVKEIELSEQKRKTLENLKKSQEGLQEAQKFFGDQITDGLSDIIFEGKKAEDVIKDLTKALAKAALQAALMGSGPLAGLFGTSGSNGNVGGLFGLLFGGGSSGTVQAASGGYVSGPGSSRSDSIPARLSNGEYVVNAAQTRKYRSVLEAINQGKVPHFADGGFVGGLSTPSIPSAASGGSSGMNVVVNNNASGQVQATPQQDNDGTLKIIIDAIKGDIAQDLLRGQGAVGQAFGAVKTGRQLRG